MKKIFGFCFLSFHLLTSAFSSTVVDNADNSTYLVSSNNPTWTNSFNSPMAGNYSLVELHPRVLPYEGKLSVGMSFKNKNREISHQCTFGFGVEGVSGRSSSYGYLTAGSCAIKKEIPGNSPVPAYVRGINHQGREIDVPVGNVVKTNLIYIPEQGINMLAVRITADYLWDPIKSTQVFVPVGSGEEVQLELVDVRDTVVANIGDRVCFYSEYSDFNCGVVEAVDTSSEALAPWQSTFKLPLGLKVPYYPLEYYNNLVHVELDYSPKALSDGVTSHDSGAPVFIPVLDRNGRIIAVKPVGIFLLYEALSPIPHMSYMPLGNLLMSRGLTLLTTPQHNSVVKNNTVNKLQPRELDIVLAYGGLAVEVISLNSGKPYQRDCTLSFPVLDNQSGKKGFLTSSFCADADNGSIFVESIEIGSVIKGIRKISPQQGNDYMFAEIYEEYWDDLVSKNIAYTEYLPKNETNFEVIVMSVPSEPPLWSDVCIYGGVSNFTCGRVAGFNSTIEVEIPGLRGPFTFFYNVVKINMDKPYELGDLGAPVYIPARVPFSPQLAAVPVGQVIEASDSTSRYNWYYVPINRILNDYNFTLLIGNFS